MSIESRGATAPSSGTRREAADDGGDAQNRRLADMYDLPDDMTPYPGAMLLFRAMTPWLLSPKETANE
jgi:hypothetical protein